MIEESELESMRSILLGSAPNEIVVRVIQKGVYVTVHHTEKH